MDNKQLCKLIIGDLVATAVIVLGLTLIMAAIGMICWNRLAGTYKWPRAGYLDALATCWSIYGVSVLARFGFSGSDEI